MDIHGLLENVEFQHAGAAVAAGSSIDNNSGRIDVSDCESVLFVTAIADSVATGVAGLKVEHNDADSDTGMEAIQGLAVTATSVENDDLNGTLLIVEIANPTKRYVQAVRTSATANIAFGEILVIKRKRIVPVTQGETVAASKAVAG